MKLNVGLIGLGRLGRVYARDLAARVTGVRLAALADTNATLAEETARELDVPRWYMDPLAMLDDPGVDAVIIVSPTDTHCDLVVARSGPRQARVLREASRIVAQRNAKDERRRRARAWLPANGLHAALRRGLCRRQEKASTRA